MRLAIAWATLALTAAAAAAASLTLPNVTFTSSGSSVLPTANDVSVNWQKAGMQLVGGIPTRSTVCATVSPLGGGSDDTAHIQSAINTCPSGQVLMLAAGTFTIKSANSILLSNSITLRGTGACNNTASPYCQTVINVPDGAVLGRDTSSSGNYNPVLIVGTQRFGVTWNTPTTLTADAAQGATSVTVASVSGFAVGQWVLIDEASGAAYQSDPMISVPGDTVTWTHDQVWAASDAFNTSPTPATGRVVWQKHNPSISGDDFASNENPSQAGGVGCYFSFCDRPTAEMHLITAINSTTKAITFDSPLTIAYRQSGNHKAQLYSPSSSTPIVTNAGVENLTIQRSTEGGVNFQYCVYCWAKNVEVVLWLNGGLNIVYAARVELNSVFPHKAAWPVPGGAEYAIDIQNAATEVLVTNSISVQAGKAITVRSGGAGSVISYNYMDDVFIGGQPSWQEMGASAAHAAGSHEVLFEGNRTHNIDGDSTHGNENYMTYLRNYASGFRAKFTDYFPGDNNATVDDINQASTNGPLRVAGPQYYNYWWTYIGNVLGTAGHTGSANGWVFSGYYTAGGPSIWMSGWRDVLSPDGYDPNVATFSFKHGNYDYFNNAIQWDPNTSNHVIPNSFYLSSVPAFYSSGTCTYPWPWVTPDQASQLQNNSCGGSGLPAMARYVAGTPFVQP